MDGLMVQPRTTFDATPPLRAYFRSFGFADPSSIERLVERILADAGPAASPEAVMACARRRVEAWFVDVLGPAIVASGAVETVGRAAFLLSDSARRWPRHFLDPGSPPAEMVEALRRAMPPSIPHAVSAMPEQSLAFAWPIKPARLLPRWPASRPKRT